MFKTFISFTGYFSWVAANVFWMVSIAGAQSIPLDLEGAVRKGLDHNASLDISRAQAREALALSRQAGAGRLPSIQTLASYTRLSDNIPEISFSSDFLPAIDTSFTLAPVELNRMYSEISVEQPVFSGMRLRNQHRAAQLQANASALQVAQEEAEVAFQIRRGYWQLYQALALQEALEESINQIQAHLDDATRRREAGLALQNDVLAAQTRLTEVQLERVEVDNAVQLARLNLNLLTGHSLDAQLSLSTEPAASPIMQPPDDLQSFDTLLPLALRAQPGLQALESQISSFEAQLNASQGAWFPTIALSGRYIYARPNQYFFTEQDQFKATWEAGLVFRWSLWDGNRRSAEVQQARARLDGAEARYQAGREQLSVAVMQRHLEMQRAALSIEAARSNESAAEESFRLVQQQYNEGVALATQVLDAEQALRLARARHLQARADYAIADAAVLEILGRVW